MTSFVADVSGTVRQGITDALRQVIMGVPDILAALVVLLLGVIVAAVLKSLVVRLLKMIQLGSLIHRLGINRVFPGHFDVVELIGDLVKWFFIVVFLLQALTIVHLQQVNDVVRQVLSYVPNVIVAVVLVLVGAVIADLTSRLIRDAGQAMGASTANLLGDVAKYAILTLVAFTTLAQLGVNTLFLDRLFTGIVVMLALAGGLAFGLGGQGVAKDLLEAARKRLQDKQ
jgi:Mechanosensitive ion channel, conserved TM helix